MKPVHEHDCDRCRLVGHHTDDTGRAWDVYESCNGSIHEYIMRWSSDGPDYMTVWQGHPSYRICQQIAGGH